jgi:CRISPR-associated protein Cmr6
MPIAAVPDYLGTDFSDASPGMRFGMYLNIWNNSFQKEKDKVEPLKRAGKFNNNDLKLMKCLLDRQQTAFSISTEENSRLNLTAIATAPFTTGLGNEHPLENGFAFLNPYGLPYLAGSGVKGVLRQAARELASGEWGETSGWDEATITTLFGKEAQDGDTELQRGALSFWDVLPQIRGNSLAVEIMTPHQSHYYQQKQDIKAGDSISPHDSGQPTPISFLTVPEGSGFTFHVLCNPAFLSPELAENQHWKVLLGAAFEHAFAWLGFGAKTAVGYGAMQSDAQKQKKLEQAEQRKQEEKRQKAEADAQRRAETAELWSGARLTFNRANGTLTADLKGKKANAIAPAGRALLDTLSPDLRKKVETNQFVRVSAYVAEGVLVRVKV